MDKKRPRQIAEHFLRTKSVSYVERECAKYENPEAIKGLVRTHVKLKQERRRYENGNKNT